MSHKEWMDWLGYFSRNGRLDPIRMYDRGYALLSSIVNKALGGTGNMEDFLPYKPRLKELSLDDVVKAFGVVKNGKSR
jgi:hypothetical protein